MRVPLPLLAAVLGLGLVVVSLPRPSPAALPARKAPTYAADVAPILDRRCVSCHHLGEVAPFSLVGYANARKHAQMIAEATDERSMPPWKAVDGFGDFKDTRVLSPGELSTLKDWAAAGAPQGDMSKAPPDPTFAPGWKLGTPDLEVAPEKPYHLAADGADVYRHFVIPTHFAEDRWVSGLDVEPGNRKVVHHVILYVDTSGTGRALEKANTDGEPGYTRFGSPGFVPASILGGWVPGVSTKMVTPGYGLFLPKGSDLVVEVHYHKSGKPETDLTRVALYFSRTPVVKRLDLYWFIKPSIDIPAGEANHVEAATRTIRRDITLYSIMPHMHLLGKSMEATATTPDGRVIPLIKVVNWDFNWQINYEFKQPIHLPAGTKVRMVATYDNTADNPRNPNDPPKEVKWGEQTTDEMCLMVGVFSVDGEKPIAQEPGALNGRTASLDRPLSRG